MSLCGHLVGGPYSTIALANAWVQTVLNFRLEAGLAFRASFRMERQRAGV
jgi:hypothetical protein